VRALSGLLALALLIACVGGCTREYVAKPDAARDANAIDWTIESAPRPPLRESTDAPAAESGGAELGSGAATDEQDR